MATKPLTTFVEDMYLTNIPTGKRKPPNGEPYIAYVCCQKAGHKRLVSFEAPTRRELERKIADFLDHTPHQIVSELP